MKELKEARMGMIAVSAVMLVSIMRRLTGTRRLSSGMMTLVVAGVVLLAAAGGASALIHITECQEITVGDEYYVLDNDIDNSTADVCIYIKADNVILDGQGYYINGVTPGTCPALDDDYFPSQTNGYARPGIAVKGQTNVTIKNVEVKNFCTGILLYGSSSKTEEHTIENCIVHDNGNPTVGVSTADCQGIALYKNVCNSTVDNNQVYNNTGKLESDCDDNGAGIILKVKCNHNNITNNLAYNNTLAGIYSKKGGGDCYNYIAYNNVHENGQTGGSFTGGIRFQCKSTDDNTFEYNIVTDNIGPGIFIGGHDCILRHNIVSCNKDAKTSGNSLGDGLRVDRWTSDNGGKNTTLYNNTFCNNEHLDINVEDIGQNVTGDHNTCNTTSLYSDTGMTTGCDYACIISCDASGNAKDEFVAGEKVYVKGGGYGLSPGASYNLWIQDDPVSDGDTLANDPSGSQETVTPSGTPPSFGPIEIWDTATNPAGLDEWDIVADKQNDGANTGEYNRASDGIDSSTIGTETMPGFVAPIPEVATFALVGIGLLGLVGYVGLVRRRKD